MSGLSGAATIPEPGSGGNATTFTVAEAQATTLKSPLAQANAKRRAAGIALVVALCAVQLHSTAWSHERTIQQALSACPTAQALAHDRDAKRAAAAAAKPEAPAADPLLRTALLKLADADQAVRRELSDLSDPAARAVLDALGHAGVEFLKRATPDGFPSREAVGQDAIDAAWLLLQHSPDTEFLRRTLARLMDDPQRFGVHRDRLAMTEDRLLLAEGKPQRYGSQVKPGVLPSEPLPMEEPLRVDGRRAAVGLMPLRDHLCVMDFLMSR